MAANEKLSLLIESQTRGTAEVEKLTQALNRVSDTAEKAGKKTADTSKTQADSILQFSNAVRDGINDPLSVAAGAVEKFGTRFGSLGATVAGGTTVIAAAGVALFELANYTQDVAEQQTNASIRLGTTIKEYGLLDQAAKNQSVSTESLVGSIKGLSKALSDNSDEGKKGKDALKEIGVEATNAFGNIKPTYELILDIADGLGKIPSPAERANAAIKILGKSGVELLPILNENLRGTIKELNDLGVGFDQVSADKANKFGDALDLISSKLTVLRKEAGLGAIELIENLFPSLLDKPGKEGETAKRVAEERKKYFDNLRKLGDQAKADYEITSKGGTLSLNAEDLLKNLPKTPGVSTDDLKSQLQSSNRVKIQGLVSASTDQLAAARKDLDDAVRSNDVDQVRRATARIALLEEEKKSLESRKQIATAVAAFESEANIQSVDGLDRIIAKRAEFLVQNKVLPAELDRVNASFLKLFNAEEKDESDKLAKSFTKLTLESAHFFEELRNSDIEAGQKKLADLAKTATEGAKAYAALTFEIAKQKIGTQAESDVRLIDAGATRGGEVPAFNQALTVRIAAARDIYAIEQKRATLELDTFKRAEILLKAKADLDKAEFEARSEREIKLLDLQKQRQEEIRDISGKVFDSLQANGGGLKDFALGQIKIQERTIFQNISGELLKGTTGKLSLPGQGAQGNPNLFGRILQGTPFGMDPLKTATDMNTAATVANTTALTKAFALSPSGGGGSAGGLVSGISALIPDSPLPFGGIPGGPGRIPGLPDGLSRVEGPDGNMINLPNTGSLTRGSSLARGVGIAGVVAGTGYGIYSGVQQGGVRGAATATASAAGGAAGLIGLLPSLAAATGPLAPILAGVGLAIPLITSLFGDPKAKRSAEIDREIESARYTGPASREFDFNSGGGSFDYNSRGQIRQAPAQINVTVQTMDAKSFMDNGPMIAESVRGAMANGQADPLLAETRGQMFRG